MAKLNTLAKVIDVLEILMTDFVLMAIVAGGSLAAAAGPLGSFMVWRRMSYFGDTLAHSALLGVSLGLVTGGNPQMAVVLSGVGLAILLSYLDRNPKISTDTLLGILAHSSLALGIVVLSLTSSIRVNLEAYLFGELLTISQTELLWVVGVIVLVLAVLLRFWNDFLSVTVHKELAEVEGKDSGKIEIILIVLIALTISVSMKIVGVLLITSLLIIPPATARKISKTPEKMALNASLIGITCVLFGIVLAFNLDTPVGPSIVVVAAGFFLCSYLYPTKSIL